MNTLLSLPNELDSNLVAAAARGDRQAFGALVNRHQSAACGVAYSICGDFTQSEDIAQDAFITAWKQLPELREPDRFRAWICGITRQMALTHVRRRTRRGDRPGSSEPDVETAADELTPRDLAISDEEKQLLWRTLDRLPESYREPLVLFYRENQSVAQAAAALELTEDAFKQRLSRGRGMLREEIARTLEGVLAKTRPGSAFTLSVLSALPPAIVVGGAVLSASTAKAALAGGGQAGAATSVGGTIGLAALGTVVSGAVGLLGLYAALQAWRSSRLAPEMREEIKRESIRWTAYALPFAAGVVYLGLSGGKHLSALGVPPALAATCFVLLYLGLNIAQTFRLLRRARSLTIEKREPVWSSPHAKPRRYRSSWSLFGLPLVNVALGADLANNEPRGVAKGWIAVGDSAYGVLAAMGGITVAPISVGGVAFGLFSLGGVAVAPLAFGGVGLGWVACAGVALGWHLAVGGFAIAQQFAVGGLAMAHQYASGGVAVGAVTESAHVWAAVKGDPLAQFAMQALPHSSWLALLSVPALVYSLWTLRHRR